MPRKRYPSDKLKNDAQKSLRIDHRVVSLSEHVPDSALREWRVRLSINPRNLTAAICGDPLPGYSALERRE